MASMFKLRRISVVNAAYHRHVHKLAHIWYVYGTQEPFASSNYAKY